MEKEKKWIDFTPKEKQNAFEQISSCYFNKNFGTMSKSDFETLMFSIYIEHCIDKKLPFDDYTLSKNLGITQSRIRALKVRKELKYPKDTFNWKDAFIESIPSARYDEVKRLVKLHISDVNVLIELRSFMDERGWYNEYQLNPKLFQCRADIFIDLCRELDDNGSPQLPQASIEKLKELEDQTEKEQEKSALQKIASGALEDGLKGLAVSASKEILLEALRTIPFGGLACQAIQAFIGVVEKS